MGRILMIGENPLMSTMFGKCARKLGNALAAEGADIGCLGFNYSGWPYPSSVLSFPLYPWVGPPTGPQNADAVLDEFKPDTLLLLGAPVLFTWLKNHGKRDNYRIVVNTVFQSLPLNRMVRDTLGYAHSIVVYSDYEKSAVTAVMEDCDIHVVPPWVDVTHREVSESHESQVTRIACVASDVPHIDIPALMKAFGIAAKERTDISFGLFAHPSQMAMWNIPDMIDVYGLSERCLVNDRADFNFGLPALDYLYHSIDCMVIPSQDSVINIPAIEASLCRTPLLTTNGEATSEYITDDNTIRLLEKTDEFIAPPLNTRYRIFDAVEIARKILDTEKVGKHTPSREIPDPLSAWRNILLSQ